MKCICFLFLALAGVFQWSSAAVTILPLGDSITEGGKHFVCYRQFLPQQLEGAGLHYTFIGPKQDAYSAHAGYSGKNTAYLASIIGKVYRQYPADVVLLHSGHNSFSKDQPVAGIVQHTDAIVRTILEINPEATVMIAQVIPAGKMPKYAYIQSLNEALAVYAKTSEFTKQSVLVNHAEGFDWRTDTIHDQVHPNAAGAEKMALQWTEAFRALYFQ